MHGKAGVKMQVTGLIGGATTGAGDDDKAGGTIESFGTEALTKAIASGGGFGIARQILRQVTAERDARQGGTKV